MNVLESVTCCVLALVTLVVFRKEILKVKDAFVRFWIPQKRKPRDVKQQRQESKKENVPQKPSSESTFNTSSPLKTMDYSGNVNEIVSTNEMSKKVTKETEGVRIKSATLLPLQGPKADESIPELSFSQKMQNGHGKVEPASTNHNENPFPAFSEILESFQKPVLDSSTSSRTEEVKQLENGITKTTKETKHEVKGNKQTSFSKTEQETVSKSAVHGDNRIPSPVSLEAIDLNNLIAETQKKLESFKNGLATADVVSSESFTKVQETKKTETVSSTTGLGPRNLTADVDNMFAPFSTSKLDPTNSSENKVNSFQSKPEKKESMPDKPKTKKDPIADSFEDCLKEMQLTLNSLNEGMGFNSSETSTLTTEESTLITKKKKMFSSSSFYEEPGSLYPTVEEQVEMARKIADSLADDTNKKSKGANMFYKRVKRSSKWIHEGPEPDDDSDPGTPEMQGVEPPTPDPSQVPFRPSKGPARLKLVLDPRHPLDANALRSSGLAISEHNVVSPDVCHGLVKDLHSPIGKGAALFAKRKKKSEDWVVDEERVKTLMREHERKLTPIPQSPAPYNQFPNFTRQDVKLVKSPWEAAMENPYGLCDAAFARVHPDQLADTVIRAADEKRRNSNTPSRQSSRMEGCFSPPPQPLPPVTPAAAHYDIYHAKAPRGWAGSAVDPHSIYNAHELPASSHYVPSEGFEPTNVYPAAKKMVFQNFNTVPRRWKPTSAR